LISFTFQLHSLANHRQPSLTITSRRVFRSVMNSQIKSSVHSNNRALPGFVCMPFAFVTSSHLSCVARPHSSCRVLAGLLSFHSVTRHLLPLVRLHVPSTTTSGRFGDKLHVKRRLHRRKVRRMRLDDCCDLNPLSPSSLHPPPSTTTIPSCTPPCFLAYLVFLLPNGISVFVCRYCFAHDTPILTNSLFSTALSLSLSLHFFNLDLFLLAALNCKAHRFAT
jgi:hypothetical protein